MMYVLLCGRPPFDGGNTAAVLEKVRAGKFSFGHSDFKDVTVDAKDLIRSLLKMDPLQRLTAEGALNHTWIKDKAPKAVPGVSLQAGFVEHLRSFHSMSHLKKAALMLIAGQVSEKNIKALRETFVALDTNGDGKLTMAEMQVGLKKAGVKELPDLSSIMEEYTDGVIDYTEFLASTLNKKLYMQKDVCWRAFVTFDQNGDGKISPEELKQVLQYDSVEEAFGAEMIAEFICAVDADGDGMIDFDEFMAMMRK